MQDPNLDPETGQPIPEVKPEETNQQPQPKPEDTVEFWKEKFSQSSGEANILREAERRRQEADKELTKEPTDSDFRTAFPEWETLDESQKADKRRIFNAERASYEARQIAKELQDERSKNTSIELAIASNSALQGRESQFRQFASRPQYKNVPVELLADAFLGKHPAEPAPTQAPVQRPSLLTGTGGPKTPERPTTLSGDELKQLRERDPRAYADYVKTHDIDDF
jgi:hypothetical protein